MDIKKKQIKDEIRAIRALTGLSQASFAFSIGVHPQTIVNWESYASNNLPDADKYVMIKQMEADLNCD